MRDRFREFGFSDPKKPLIACEIVDKISMLGTEYCTLSYCAGESTETTVILVNGFPFNAFANLEHAIRQTQQLWASRKTNRELMLWVDQICINQSDHVEKAHQVQLMRDIYRRSDETFICLSTERHENQLDWISTSGLAVTSRSHHSPAVSDVRSFLLKEYVPHQSNAISELKASLVEMFQEGVNLPLIKTWFHSLEDFTASKWWRRSWVYQEFIVSPRPCFLSGSRAIPWSDISPLIDFLSSDLNASIDSILSDANDQALSEHKKKLAGQDDEEVMQLNRLREAEYEEQKREYEARIAKINMANLQREKLHLFTQRSIINSQYMFGHQKCTCKRLFCKLCHWEDEQRIYLLEPRVRNILDGLLKEHLDGHSYGAISKMPKGSKKKLINLLCWSVYRIQVAEGDEIADCEMPTSFHCYCEEQKKLGLFAPNQALPKPPDRPYLAPLPSSQDQMNNQWTDLHGRIRSVQRRLAQLDFTTIASMSADKKSRRRPSDLKVALQHSRNCEASDPRDRVYAFLGLGDKEYAIVPDYSGDNAIVHVLITTARRIIEKEKGLDILHYTSQGRDKFGHFLPSWVPDWTSKRNSCGFARYCSSLQRTSTTDLEGGGSNGTKPFCASKGLPTEPEFRVDKMDKNVDLKVKGVFVGTLDGLHEPSKDEPGVHSLLTADGQVVIASRTALVDDEVWVLHGASKPVVLRPENGEYGFVSEAVMYEAECSNSLSDVMFGRMIDSAEKGEVKTQEIWLR